MDRQRILAVAYAAARRYGSWGWPLVLADAWREYRGIEPRGFLAALNLAALAWVLVAIGLLVAFLADRALRERLISRLCGVHESDERERAVTGEAARAVFLLSLAFQVVLLVLTLMNVRLRWDPSAPRGQRGVLELAMTFSTAAHLPLPGSAAETAPPPITGPGRVLLNGYLLPPGAFLPLALLLVLEVSAFRVLSRRRYEGLDG